MAEYRAKVAETAARRVLDSIPALAEFKDNFTIEPSPNGPLIYMGSTRPEAVVEGVSWMTANGNRSNLVAGVDKWWEDMHQLPPPSASDAREEDADAADGDEGSTECLRLGMCLQRERQSGAQLGQHSYRSRQARVQGQFLPEVQGGGRRVASLGFAQWPRRAIGGGGKS